MREGKDDAEGDVLLVEKRRNCLRGMYHTRYFVYRYCIRIGGFLLPSPSIVQEMRDTRYKRPKTKLGFAWWAERPFRGARNTNRPIEGSG